MSIRRLSAFTLVEILVVVVILAIAAMISVPYLSTSDANRLGPCSRIVMSNLFYAQNYAITHQRTVYVAFITDESGAGNRCEVYATVASTPPTDFKDLLLGPGGERMRTVFMPTASSPQSYVKVKQVSLNGSTASSPAILAFDYLGQPLAKASDGTFKSMTAPATITLAMRKNANSTQQLVVQPLTGEIQIQ